MAYYEELKAKAVKAHRAWLTAVVEGTATPAECAALWEAYLVLDQRVFLFTHNLTIN